MAQQLQQDWGKPVVVENRPGANAQIGADAVAKAAPDGHTLLAITLTHAVNASLFPQAPYDFLRDLKTLSLLGPCRWWWWSTRPRPGGRSPTGRRGRDGARLNVGSRTGSRRTWRSRVRRATGAGASLVDVPYRGARRG